MAGEKDRPPTAKRLKDARDKGDVVHSADVASAMSFAVVLGAMWVLGPVLFDRLRGLWEHATSPRLLTRPDERFPELLLQTGEVLVWATVVISAIAALAGFAGSFFQVGGLMAWQRLKPDIKRIDPVEGGKRLFSSRNLFNLAKMIVKTLLLAGLLYGVVSAELDTALKLGHATPAAIMAVGARLVLATFAWAAVIYVAMSAADYANQHYQHLKSLRMSLDEVRREYKDMEGDPTHRGRRKSAHFEAVYFPLADRVRAASAVIVANGVAVGLQYLGPDDLPRVIAKGEGDLAVRIRSLATEALVPMSEDATLAARLLEVGLDMPIPRPLYAPVARLLRWAGGESG